MYTIFVKSNFNSAHNLRNYNGKCENLHGHSWKVELLLEYKTLNNIGISKDFKIVKDVLNEHIEILDHKYLNEIEPFDKINPSAENIAKYFYDKLKLTFPELVEVFIWESENARASYKK